MRNSIDAPDRLIGGRAVLAVAARAWLCLPLAACAPPLAPIASQPFPAQMWAENAVAGVKAIAAAVAAVIPSTNPAVSRITAYASDATSLFAKMQSGGSINLTNIASDAEAVVALAETFSPSPSDTLILAALQAVIPLLAGTPSAAPPATGAFAQHALVSTPMSIDRANAILAGLPRP